MNFHFNEKKSLQISFIFFSVLVVFAVVFGAWLWYGSLEESITGMGQLIPESKVRRVMSPITGVAVKVLVSEDQNVKKDEVLIELDPEISNVETNNYAEQLHYLMDESNALKSASIGGNFAPSKGQSQSAWLQATKQAYEAQSSAAQMQITRAEHLKKQSQERIKQIEQLLQSSEKMLLQYKKLKDEDGLSEKEYIEYEQKVVDLRGQLASSKEELKAREIEHEQAKQALKEVTGSYKKEILTRLLDHEQNVLRLSGELAKQKASKKLLQIKSPVDGIVNEQIVKGEGEVVSPGEVLLSLVPHDTKMLAEVRVTNKDLAYIHIGQRAALRLDALPYNKFGRLDGSVVAISASTQQDKEGNAFYLIRIKPDKNTLKSDTGQSYPLRSGMTLTADIITREKNILSFFTEPIHYHFDRAFRDPSDR